MTLGVVSKPPHLDFLVFWITVNTPENGQEAQGFTHTPGPTPGAEASLGKVVQTCVSKMQKAPK